MPSATLLDSILSPGALSVLFQPIYELKEQTLNLVALEALTRGPAATNAHSADVLFEYARRRGAEQRVDRLCIELALREAATIPFETAISVNIHAATVERDTDFPLYLFEACERYGIAPSRLILELIEQQRFWDESRFHHVLGQLRDAGVRIAVDDVGLGYSNHRMIAEIRPDIVKVDRYFVNGCRDNNARRAVVESIVLLACRLGGRVIAEGIETRSDLECVASLGIDMLQGFLFARPLSARCVVQRLNKRATNITNSLEGENS